MTEDYINNDFMFNSLMSGNSWNLSRETYDNNKVTSDIVQEKPISVKEEVSDWLMGKEDFQESLDLPEITENKPLTVKDELSEWIINKDKQLEFSKGGHLKLVGGDNFWINGEPIDLSINLDIDSLYTKNGFMLTQNPLDSNPLDTNYTSTGNLNNSSSNNSKGNLAGGEKGVSTNTDIASSLLPSLAPIAGGFVGNLINNTYADDGMNDQLNNVVYGNSGQDPLKRLVDDIGGVSYDNAIDTLNQKIKQNLFDFKVGDNSLLLSLYEAYGKNRGPYMGQLKEKNAWQAVADNLNASGLGALQGSAFGPWGALIGGIIGGVANVGSQLMEGSKRDSINSNIKRYNDSFALNDVLYNNTVNTSKLLDTLNQLILPNITAYGGYIDNPYKGKTNSDIRNKKLFDLAIQTVNDLYLLMYDNDDLNELNINDWYNWKLRLYNYIDNGNYEDIDDFLTKCGFVNKINNKHK